MQSRSQQHCYNRKNLKKKEGNNLHASVRDLFSELWQSNVLHEDMSMKLREICRLHKKVLRKIPFLFKKYLYAHGLSTMGLEGIWQKDNDGDTWGWANGGFSLSLCYSFELLDFFCFFFNNWQY